MDKVENIGTSFFYDRELHLSLMIVYSKRNRPTNPLSHLTTLLPHARRSVLQRVLLIQLFELL